MIKLTFWFLGIVLWVKSRNSRIGNSDGAIEDGPSSPYHENHGPKRSWDRVRKGKHVMDTQPSRNQSDILFIAPNHNITSASPDLDRFARMSKGDIRSRWKTEQGNNILLKWRQSGYDRACIEQLVGKLHGQLDLRGIPLKEAVLKGCNLQQTDLFYADLLRADLSRSKLKDAYLSEADIRGTKFDWSDMNGVLMDNVQYDVRTSFQGVDIAVINFNLAALLRDLATSQQRINHLKQRNPILASLLWITSDYGMSPMRFFLWLIGIVAGFAIAYHCIPGVISHQDILSCLYFSVISFTTLGYGDIVPSAGIGQVLAMLEVTSGYLMGGMFVVILARKLLLG